MLIQYASKNCVSLASLLKDMSLKNTFMAVLHQTAYRTFTGFFILIGKSSAFQDKHLENPGIPKCVTDLWKTLGYESAILVLLIVLLIVKRGIA